MIVVVVVVAFFCLRPLLEHMNDPGRYYHENPNRSIFLWASLIEFQALFMQSGDTAW